MNVLAITSLFPTEAQPEAGLFNFHQLNELTKDVELSLIVPVPWRLWFKKGGKNRVPPNSPALEIFETPYLYPPGVAYGWHGYFYSASIRGAVRKLAAQTRFDLVYGMFAYPDGWAAGRVAEKLGLPFVLKVHGTDVHQLREDPSRNRRLRESLERAKRVVAVSDQLAGEVRELAPNVQVHVVRNGVDSSFFRPGSQEEARDKLGLLKEEPVVLYVGRMEKVKGADLLPEIARRMKHDVQWVLIGRGSLAGKVMSQMPIVLTWWISDLPHPELVTFYQAADVVVVPSRREGIPNSFLEALACDRTVVASAVGGIPEILKDSGAGRLVPPGDLALFARTIDDILSEPLPAGRARGMVSELSWGTSGRKLRAVFEGAIRG